MDFLKDRKRRMSLRRVAVPSVVFCILLLSVSCSTGDAGSFGAVQVQETLLWDANESLAELEQLGFKLTELASTSVDIAILQITQARLYREAKCFKEWLLSENQDRELKQNEEAARRAEMLRNAISALRLQVAGMA